MKYIKKIILFLLIFVLVGCGREDKPRDIVMNYLDKYKNKDEVVIEQLDEYIAKEDLNNNQKEIYKGILLKEYETLEYEVKNETYVDNEIIFDIQITVFDLYKIQKKASEYFNEHISEFNDEDGKYDRSKFIDYKLDLMGNATEVVSYNIKVVLTKKNNKYVINQLSNEDLEKIHGVFNYEE